ncbi:MAG: HEPN domain-containing protein [Promethearchaeota archaeon]
MERAERWIQGATGAIGDERWDDAVYSLEMGLEQAMKAMLLLMGIEYSKVHDISPMYVGFERDTSLPDWFREVVPAHAKLLTELVDLRGISAYGYIQKIPLEFFAPRARELSPLVSKALEECERLWGEFTREVDG